MELSTVSIFLVTVATLAFALYRNYTRNYRKWTSVPGLPSLRHTGSFHLCGTKWHQEHRMKFKEFSPIKWRPPSIFFARSVAFEVDIIQLLLLQVPIW